MLTVNYLFIFQEDVCEIGGKCYEVGHVFSQDNTRICLPRTNVTIWTKVESKTVNLMPYLCTINIINFMHSNFCFFVIFYFFMGVSFVDLWGVIFVDLWGGIFVDL